MGEGKITPLQFLEEMHKPKVDTYVVLLSCYLPICEYDANTAIVLARIVYWRRCGFRIHINGEPVLAKSAKEMCEETGLKNRHVVERAYNHLKELGIISTVQKRFNKLPTLHITLHLEVLFQRYQHVINEHQLQKGLPLVEIPSHLLEKPKRIKVVRKEKADEETSV